MSSWPTNGNLQGNVSVGQGEPGKSLEYMWRGTELGIRVEGEEEYQFVDLAGSGAASGREIELQVGNGFIQWRYKGDEEWNNLISLDSLKGAKGDKGERGQDGTNGKDGITPNIQIGTVTTLEAGQQATVTKRGTDAEPIFDFAIPKGEKGNDGTDGITPDMTEFEKKINEQYETIEPKIEFNEFPQEIQGVIINDNYIGVMPLDFIDGVLYGFKNNTTLVKSSDDGITWEDIIRIPFGSVMCIFKCADGEMLIGNNGQLVKTIGWEINPKTCTFSQNKLPNKTPGVGTLRWGIDGDGIKFIVTEYSGSDRGESRYIWVSTDMGNTFNVVYDKYTTDPTNTSHMHGVCYDKWADRFFVSHGHGVLRGVYYSDNDGVTWNKISGNFQPDAAPTTLIATDDGIVCGSDSADGGLYGILRTEKPEDMEMRKICRWNVEREGVTGFAFKSVRDKRGHVYVSFKSDFDDVPSVIMAGTANSATTVWTSPTKEANSFLYLGVTDKKIIGVTLKGAIYKKIEGFKKVGKQSYQFDKGNMNYGESRIATSINVGTGREITTFRETVVGCKAGVMPGVSGSNNVIIGFDAHANARSVVIGSEAMSDKNDTVSIGKGTSCQGIFGTAIGVGANVMNNATNGTAIGSKATSFVNGTAIGSEASASEGSANGATAIGSNAKAGSFSTAIGNNAQAKGVNQMAIGKGAISTHTNSIALGIGVTTTTTDQLAIGKKHIELDVLDNDPVSVPDNKARLYIIKNTSGKIELRVRIGGNNIVLATQP